jgi:hypothetical protein
MKKEAPSKILKFRNDAEIAAFMEKYSAFDLVDAGLAEIIPTPLFVRAQEEGKTLLKNKRIQVAFKDERSLRKAFSPFISSARTFSVVDTDSSGILLSLPDALPAENFYVPYLNISGIKILERTKKRTASMKSVQRMAQGRMA